MFLNDMEGGDLVDSKGRRVEFSFFFPFLQGVVLFEWGLCGVERCEFFPLFKGGWEECLWEEEFFFYFPKGDFLGWHGEREVWFFCRGRERMDQGPPKYAKLLGEYIFLKTLNWMQFIFNVNLVKFCTTHFYFYFLLGPSL